MWESPVGLLTPTTRQNSGSGPMVRPAGVVSAPPLTVVAVATLVLPSKVSRPRSAQDRRAAAAAPDAGCAPRRATAPAARAPDTASRTAADFTCMSPPREHRVAE